MDEKCLLVDVSLYQPKMDWSVMAENDVVGVIAKASQGSYRKDPLFLSHVEGATKAGLVVGAYHWSDPTNDDEAQAEHFINTVKGLPVKFLAIDMEQYWKYWSEFYVRKINTILPGSRISQNAYRVASILQQETDLPVIIYTRASFVMYRAPEAVHWLPKFHLWLAHYPYSRTRIKTTWVELREKYLPVIDHPMRPVNCKQWLLWQFSGDKFYLEGTGGGSIDLNFFNGDKKAFMNFIKTGKAPEPPPEPSLPRKARTLTSLNIRRAPDVAANPRIGRLPWGSVVDVFEVRYISMDKWARIGENQWVAMEFRNTILMIWA